MRLDKLLIGLGIFLLFITAGVSVMFGRDAEGNTFYENYNVNVSNTSFNEIPSDFNKVYNVSKEGKTDITEHDVTVATGWESMTVGAYKALKGFFASFSIVGEILQAIAKVIGIPPFFVSFAAIAFMITALFTIIYMIFRFMPRD